MNRATSASAIAQRFALLFGLILLTSASSPGQSSPGQMTVYFPSATRPQTTRMMTVDDVIRLSKAGLSDDVIIQQIKKKGQRFDLSTDQLVQLKSASVSERVIQAMIDPTKDSRPSPTEKTGPPAPQQADQSSRASSASSTATNNAVAADAPKQNLSDDFAKAGLKALKAIEGTLGQVSIENGSIAVPRQPQELIDNADAEARTDAERTIVAALNKFYIGRLENNMDRELLTPHYSWQTQSEAQAEQAIKMNSREAACSNAIDQMLRTRDFTGNPDACACAVVCPSAARGACA